MLISLLAIITARLRVLSVAVSSLAFRRCAMFCLAIDLNSVVSWRRGSNPSLPLFQRRWHVSWGTVLSQLVDFVPQCELRQIVKSNKGEYRVRRFFCWNRFLCLAFVQLTCRESLWNIETCLRSVGSSLYHAGSAVRALVRR